tara:strand:+ start:1916 stop:2311 length:396 start_codon:yes stop_codon:yes gene_type:complete
MDKISLSKAFSNHFIDFLNEVTVLFPKNVKIRTFRTAVKQIKAINPSQLIKSWYKFVTVKYKNQIYSEDFQFFESEDYSGNLKNTKWDANDIYSFIDEMKRSSNDMSLDNKKKTMKYISNLTKMSEMYHNK